MREAILVIFALLISSTAYCLEIKKDQASSDSCFISESGYIQKLDSQKFANDKLGENANIKCGIAADSYNKVPNISVTFSCTKYHAKFISENYEFVSKFMQMFKEKYNYITEFVEICNLNDNDKKIWNQNIKYKKGYFFSLEKKDNYYSCTTDSGKMYLYF